MRPYLTGERVTTPDHGPGSVITDWRAPMPLEIARDTVWVLLDAGANPQPYRGSELRSMLKEAS